MATVMNVYQDETKSRTMIVQEQEKFITGCLRLVMVTARKMDKNIIAKNMLEFIRDTDFLNQYTLENEECGNRFRETVKRKLLQFWDSEPITHVWIPGIYHALFGTEILKHIKFQIN